MIGDAETHCSTLRCQPTLSTPQIFGRVWDFRNRVYYWLRSHIILGENKELGILSILRIK